MASRYSNQNINNNKDAENGIVGITSFKINFKNLANTFTSFFRNSNTASRLYTFKDRDGTIADDTDLGLKINISDIIDNVTSTDTNKPLSANQGKLLKDLIDAISVKNICQLFWSNGDPTVSGNAIPAAASISGNTVIQSNTGYYQARLTTATNGISGKLEWNFSLDLEDSYFATFEHFAGGGTGADGMIYYFGCDVSPNSAVGPTNLSKGIAITIDEYNDRLRVYVNGSQVAEVTSLTSFDNFTWQKWYVQVRGDFIEVVNINYSGTWIFPVKTSGIDMSGTYHGVQAQTGGANNEHYARFIALYNGIKGGLVAS